MSTYINAILGIMFHYPLIRILSLSLFLLLLSGCAEDISTLFNTINSESLAQTQSRSQAAPNSSATTINPDLKILTHPKSVTVFENQPLTLSVSAQSSLPIRFQWYKNNSMINGATLSSYTVPKSKIYDQGFYHVLLKTEHAERRSLTAKVSYQIQAAIPLVIIQNPQAQSLTAGDALRLNVVVSGEGPFSYRWQKNGLIIPGATGSSYYVAHSQTSHSGTYQVIVSNASRNIASAFAYVLVDQALKPVHIYSQPVSQVVTEDNAARFSVSASGSGFIHYQWRKNGKPIANANLASLYLPKVSTADAGLYDVVVSSNLGNRSVSKQVSLSVQIKRTPLKINQHPFSQTITEGRPFALNVAIQSDTASSYQWFRGDKPITGARSASYRVLSASPHDQGSYSVLVRNTDASMRSKPAIITVIKPKTTSIELSWDTPKMRVDGSPLARHEIQAYIIQFGHYLYDLNHEVKVNHQLENRYVLRDIRPGILYLRIATIDSDGYQGEFSDSISVNIHE